MKRRFFQSTATLAAASIATWNSIFPSDALAQDIRVFAAASLKTALDNVVQDYLATHSHSVSLSYGGTPTLARQISYGAPADIFLSASPLWMDELSASGHIETATLSPLLGNRLVLIASATEPNKIDLATLPEHLGQRRLAMAQVDAVPAGIYGKAALEYFGLWTELSDRVAQTDNVRAALHLVASGAAPYGIVYATDATADARVQVVFTFPEHSHPKIIYPVAVISGHLSPPVAEFLSTLTSQSATRRFQEQGFIPLAKKQ